MTRLLSGATRVLTPLAVLAAILGVLQPSPALAARSDLLLAGLVLATALGISVADLARLREHVRTVVVLSVVPLVVLAAAGWLIGRPFAAPVRDGLLGVGLSSAEVASVGLVALAGADATIALGALAGSLILAALLGPVAIGRLGGAGTHADSVKLLGRFTLVVILPLIVGVALRSSGRLQARLRALDEPRDGLSALIVVVLVYAALSGTHGAHHLAAVILASALFLVVAGALALAWQRRMASSAAAVPGAMGIAMRDFAVAAALATQAFGPAAGAVPGVYGVMMLIAGAVTASRLSVKRRP